MAGKIDETTLAIRESIDSHENFVLQGGAGSGKTQSLKETIEYISKEYPYKNLLCITHTNLAVNEIKSRIDGDFVVSTIHSFLNDLIKDFKGNIKEEMIELFSLEKMSFSKEVESVYKENDYKKKRYEKYKKLYKQCGILCYAILKKELDKVLGKRDFDQKYEFDDEGNIVYNPLEEELNITIEKVNDRIKEDIISKPSSSVHYNNSKFNDRESLGYGHDGLIEIAGRLIDKYDVLKKILQDRFDFILIDEYQDTNPDIIKAFINRFTHDSNTIGLFGDSMQTIYDEGIGNIQEYVKDGKLKEIVKEDNYRSSYPVVDFINNIRIDGLKQNVAFKEISPGIYEEESNRQGEVTFFYVISNNRDNPVADLVNYVLKDRKDYNVLMLTNRLIATELQFENLYRVFSDRGLDPMERMEEDLSILLLRELYEIINEYNKENYNFVIKKLNKNGWVLRRMKDKIEISKALEKLTSKNRSIIETLDVAFNTKILRKTEQYRNYISRKDKFLRRLEQDHLFEEFEIMYNKGFNTYPRINGELPGTYTEYSFEEYSRNLKRKNFYTSLFSKDLKFNEAMNYFEYILEDGKNKTMHKTKGSGLQNVAIVLENFGWNKYNFSFRNMFHDENSNNVSNKSLNLFYVACSRAIENLIIMKFVKDEAEINMFKEKFKHSTQNIDFEEINIAEFYAGVLE